MIREKRRKANAPIVVFGALNFVFAGICFLWSALNISALIYGIFYSGDTEEKVKRGAIGLAILALPGLMGMIVYFVAGLGLLKRWKLGYYFHLVGAVFAGFSCIGIIYTVFAFLYAFRPEFSREFSPEVEDSLSQNDEGWSR